MQSFPLFLSQFTWNNLKAFSGIEIWLRSSLVSVKTGLTKFKKIAKIFNNNIEKGCIMLLKMPESIGFMKWSPIIYKIPLIKVCRLCTTTFRSSKIKIIKTLTKIWRTPNTSLQNLCKNTSDLKWTKSSLQKWSSCVCDVE